MAKSTTLRAASVAVAQGRDFLGWRVKPGATLYLALEGHRARFVEQLRALGLCPEDPFFLAFDLGERMLDNLERWVREHDVRLVVVDTLQRLVRLATGTDLTDKAGKLIATVMGWKDEAFLDDLRDKTRRGLGGQVRRGFSAGGRTYGYRTEPATDATRVDAYGQPATAGYRKVIVEEDAQVVHRIFEEFASGRSPKAIAHDLNRDLVPPPRKRRTQGWTWTAIVGNRFLGTGILNNPIYVGRVVWNRFCWVKNPETGKRVPRLRPQDDWVVQEHPELRIVPQELWERVKARQAEEVRKAEGRSKRQRHGRHLFSGLLRCGVCGANYIVYNTNYYACSAHTNRGNTICPNGKVARRTRLEKRLLAAIYEEVFNPEAISYLLQEVEVRIRELRALQETPALGEIPTFNLRTVVESKMKDLAGVLGRDMERARTLLQGLLGPIVLQPTAGGVVAELRANVEGLLPLEKALTGLSGSGGRI